MRHLYRSVKYWFNFSLSCQKIGSHLTPEEYFWKCVTEMFSCIFQNNIWIRRVVTIRKEQIMKMQIICPGVVTTYWSNNDAKIQIIVKTNVIFLNNLDSCLFQECSPDVYQIKVFYMHVILTPVCQTKCSLVQETSCPAKISVWSSRPYSYHIIFLAYNVKIFLEMAYII